MQGKDGDRMNKAFKKIINSIKELADYNGNAYLDSADIIEIVQEVAEEYHKEEEIKNGRVIVCDMHNQCDYINHWIPCSDRLPEDDSICIVTVEYPNNKTMVDYGWFDRKSVCWFVGMQEFRTSNVLAWQPLPEPFKERD